jgi:hypothetical protein
MSDVCRYVLPLVALLVLPACVRSQRSLPPYEDDPAAGRLLDEDAEAGLAAPGPGAPQLRQRTGTIARAELEPWLDAGPPRFLAGVRLTALVDKVDRRTRFRGWTLTAFWPGDPRFAGVDLLPGDVILRVNGVVPVRPEHLQTVWDGLREATTLVVDVERPSAGGRQVEAFQLRYEIVEAP